MQASGGLTALTEPSIVDALDLVGRSRPDSPVLQWRSASWTYSELLRAIHIVRTRVRPLEPGSRVAILLRNSPQYVAACYGVMAAGCVAVPLNAHDRASVLARQVEHCGARGLIGESAHKEWDGLRRSVSSTMEIISVTTREGEDPTEALERDLGVSPDAAVGTGSKPDQLAMILYTSGTTGQPKGVMLSHRNLFSNAVAIAKYLKITESDRGLCVLPFHFSYGNSVLNSHLLSGATLLIEDNLAYPHVTLERIQNDQVNGFAGVPSTFALILGRCRLQDYDLRSLRYITQAGGPMPLPMIERLREATPGIEIFIMYGQTEATARLTYLPPAMLDSKAGSVGTPIEGVEIAIRRDGRRAAANTTGTIFARGPNTMLGYWNDREATERVLNDGWLNTGDLGHLDDDGFLYIDGRAAEMIKVGAFRISPQEVEEVISGLAGVEEVAVTAVADDVLGQAIVAAIVPTAPSQLDVRAVKAHCHQHLAAYKIPKFVEFVSELPRTSSGKVQRFELAKKVKRS